MFTGKRLLTVSGSSVDPYFNNVKLLVHAEGANGSTTFIDSSNFNTTLSSSSVSFGEQIQISTVDKKFGLASIYTKGSVNIHNFSVDRRFTGNFTIEFFVKAIDYGTGYCLYSVGNESFGRVNFGVDEFGFITVDEYNNGNVGTLCTPTYFTKNVWHHVAIVRNGSSSGNVKLYLNGIYRGQITYTGTMGNSNGFYFAGDNYFQGTYYMDELRVTDGIARYTSNFTVPPKAFPDR